MRPAGFAAFPHLQPRRSAGRTERRVYLVMVSLVLGGARSGKSRFALGLGADSARAVYIATGRVEDTEMAARVAKHRRERPGNWITIEEPLEIANAVERHSNDCDFLLVDCLTFWLSNFCWEHRQNPEPAVEAAALREVARVAANPTPARIVLVTNEVGCGIVPETPVGRFFRDLQGRVNQESARLADEVFHMVAGIPIEIKHLERCR
jgi:adenosylcobinamide kinase/adenosylcobinamide-phosphate guanylyltransferase